MADLMPTDAEFFNWQGADANLTGVDFGNAGNPHMVLVHGMRDLALALTPIAEAYRQQYHVIAPDLRGHGESENPGSYAMSQFVADLRAMMRNRGIQQHVLIGHSLGGHIVSRYAALYPEDVRALVLIDGMGPPRMPGAGSILARSHAMRGNTEDLLKLNGDRRQLQDADEAFNRLTRNNPRLDHQLARLMIAHGVEPHPDGGVRWKFDPRVQMVWSTLSHEESELLWELIDCPVLVITGEYAMNYWASRWEHMEGLQELHDEEIKRRCELFKQARHVSIPEAGHMIHYDEPVALNAAIGDFLAQIPD